MMSPCERAVTLNSGESPSSLHDEGVVATDDQGVAHALEHADVLVLDDARTAVQQFRRAVDRRAKCLAEGLVPEAHPEHRNALSAHARMISTQLPASRGCPGPGETSTPSGAISDDLRAAHLIVATYLDLGSQFGHVLDEVVDERVVVVDDEDRSARCSLRNSRSRTH